MKTVLQYVSKPALLWHLAGIKLKEKFQKLVFPQGMRFDKEKDQVLTSQYNEMFVRNAELARELNGKGELSSPFLLRASLSADLGCQLSNDFLNSTLANVKIPDDFDADLEKIEAFYDLHLQEIIPLDSFDWEGTGADSQTADDNAQQANNGDAGGQF